MPSPAGDSSTTVSGAPQATTADKKFLKFMEACDWIFNWQACVNDRATIPKEVWVWGAAERLEGLDWEVCVEGAAGGLEGLGWEVWVEGAAELLEDLGGEVWAECAAERLERLWEVWVEGAAERLRGLD